MILNSSSGGQEWWYQISWQSTQIWRIVFWDIESGVATNQHGLSCSDVSSVAKIHLSSDEHEHLLIVPQELCNSFSSKCVTSKLLVKLFNLMVAQDEQPKSGTILWELWISTAHVTLVVAVRCCMLHYRVCITHWQKDSLTLLQTSFMYTLPSRNLFEVGLASFDFT